MSLEVLPEEESNESDMCESIDGDNINEAVHYSSATPVIQDISKYKFMICLYDFLPW